jgi:hypothetical protein
MEKKESLPFAVTVSSLKQEKSTLHVYTCFNLCSHRSSVLQNGLFPSGFPIKALCEYVTLPSFYPTTCSQIFCSLTLPPQTLVQQIGKYAPADLTTMYKKYKHKRLKRILL